jgi:chitin disaccharide deacetylase
MRKLIITADDFGLSPAVNVAVEKGHRDGVLTAASLMVGASAAADAVDRARRTRSLRVGLHLVLVGGTPVSPPRTVPDLVNDAGEFSSNLFRAGVIFFFRPGVRRQLEREIRAQFEAFRKTGLELDHVNCHNHMHLHPTVGRLLVEVGREYGLRAVRFPYEPALASWRVSHMGLAEKALSGIFLRPWLAILKNRIRRAHLRSNQFLFGIHDTGNMRLERVLRMLRFLPQGVGEIYFHPAAHPSPDLARTMPNYRHQEELAALTSPKLRQALADLKIQPIGFADLIEE